MSSERGRGLSRRDFFTLSAGVALGYGFAHAVHWRKIVQDGGHDGARALVHNDRPDALSIPIDRLRRHYDVAVIGSGYGGAIVAARLAGMARKICVLERGREWAPGEFPANALQLAGAARVLVNPLGLFDPNVQLQNDMDTLVACGVGGGSLINGAISLRPEPLVFAQKEWPAELRGDGKSPQFPLEPYFVRAEQMLTPAVSANAAAFGVVKEHQRVLLEKGVAFATAPLNVSRSSGTNSYGRAQGACVGCGDCVTGCNYSAKNTLAMNYLPLAKSQGAEVFSGVEARTIEKDDELGVYTINYIYHAGGLSLPAEGSVTAKTVVLAAGSLGSTEILLRSQDDGLRFSSALGSKFSANADIVGMGYNGNNETNASGFGSGSATEAGVVGPTIASYGDYRTGSRELEQRFLLFAGAVPSGMVDSTKRSLGLLAALGSLSKDQLARVRADLEGRGLARAGALNHSLLFLACGHDSGAGKLVLGTAGSKSDRVRISWPGSGQEPCFKAISAEMADCAKRMGAQYIEDPHSKVFAGDRQLTVHPLGGCPMGDSIDEGVVDHRGRVFDAEGTIHKGLFVADGAIVPRSLGVPPLLTISALAERIAEYLAKD